MRQTGTLLLALSMIFAYSISANGELINRGGGLIYDTDLDVTWLQDANYAMTSGYDCANYQIVSQRRGVKWVTLLSGRKECHHGRGRRSQEEE